MSKRPALTMEEKEQAKALLASGMTCHAVAQRLGRDPKTIQKYALEPENAVSIREMKVELADFYESLAKRMLMSITDDDIHRINAYQRTISAGIATDKARLLRDHSTANISVVQVVQRMDVEQRKVREILDRLSREENGD